MMSPPVWSSCAQFACAGLTAVPSTVRRIAACARTLRRNPRTAASTIKPVTSAISAFEAKSIAMVCTGTCSASNSGSISSEVERKTATSVPSVTTRPAYSVAAIAENPHCGTMPNNDPTTGPAAPARLIAPLTRSPATCSSVSRARYVTNKNGTSDSVSLPASSRISISKSMTDGTFRVFRQHCKSPSGQLGYCSCPGRGANSCPW